MLPCRRVAQIKPGPSPSAFQVKGSVGDGKEPAQGVG